MVTAKLNLASDLVALAANTAGPSARAARRALRLERWIVAVRTRQLGHGHKDTLLAQYNPALLLRSRRELSDALPLHRTVYEGLVEVLGTDRPDTLRAAHGYALALRDSGEGEAARDLNADIHRHRLHVLGPDHPDVLRSAAVTGTVHGSCCRTRTSAAATCWGRTIPIRSASGIGRPSSCARRDGRTGPNR
ncbi:hypothetical protein ACVWXB_006543 [Streptomyces sp. TE12347]